jgi:hypothetical protein
LVRKLIRPALDGAKPGRGPKTARKPAPPEETHAEANYLQQATDGRTLLVVTLLDGRVIKGRLEYYDRDSLKIEPSGGARMLLRKDKIKYYRSERVEAASAEESASS